MFEDAIKAAVAYKESVPSDFIEEVMRTIDYFDEKVWRHVGSATLLVCLFVVSAALGF